MTPAELTEAREALYLSQRDLAAALGVHPTVVNRWERGHAKVPPYLWLALKGLQTVPAPASPKHWGCDWEEDGMRCVYDSGHLGSHTLQSEPNTRPMPPAYSCGCGQGFSYGLAYVDHVKSHLGVYCP